MEFFILTLGTRGDIELFLTLGRELRRRGHGVVLGTTGFYATRVREARIESAQVGNGTQAELIAVLRSLSSIRDTTERTYRYFRTWLEPQLSTGSSQVTALAGRADYFISNLKIVLRRAGKTMPGAAVTYDPPGALDDLAKYRTQEHDGRILDLVAMNRRLIDPDGRWGEAYRFTGFWSEPEKSAWTHPAGLEAFLDGGAPPVVITLGSMTPCCDTAGLMRAVAEALRAGGRRGIVLGSWSGAEAHAAGSHLVCYESEVPYDWLFPRASCVIHHGGCGTVAAVLRAGKPSIVLPQVTCQEHFAWTLVRNGLATGVIDVHALDPGTLTAAVERAITDQQVVAAARTWQQIVAEDPGVTGAADLVEAHWQTVSRE